MTATTNLVTNPSWETNLNGWTAANLATYARSPSYYKFGGYSAYILDAVSGSDEYLISDQMAVIAGNTYTASCYLLKYVSNSAYTGACTILWENAASAIISSVSLTLPAGTITSWTRITLSGLAPAGAVYACLLFADAGITAGTWQMSIDGVQFEEAAAATAYCDGDQAGCSWNGVAHASTSSRWGPADYTTITLTDGTTTLTLTDGVNYQLVDGGWAPAVAPLRISTLGGRGAYENVVEEMTVNVLGDTGATALWNLGRLSALLDQAERWARGDPVTLVKLTCRPQGSTLIAALSCIILGRADDSGAMATPVTFNDLLMCYEIPNVRLRILRRGLWLAATDTVGPSAAADVVTIQTATFGNPATAIAPASVTLIEVGPTIFDFKNAFLLIAKAADRIDIVEAEAFVTTSGAWSVVDDTAKAARGTDVLRLTPAATTAYSNSKTTLGISVAVKRVGIFAAVRNNSATVTWRMQAYIQTTGSPALYGPEIQIDASSQDPQIVYLGSISTPGYVEWLGFLLTASSTSGSPTFDIDYFAMIALEDATSTVIALNPTTTASQIDRIVVDARELTALTAEARGAYVTAVRYFAYRGDASIGTYGSVIATCLLATGGKAATYWRLYDDSTTLTQFTLTATRNLAFLTPQ